jgi:hypothetical protein
MVSKMGATLTLVGVVAAMYGGNYVIDRLPNPVALFAPPGPKFKVEYKSHLEDRQTQCGRNLCPSTQVEVMRLTLQSLNEQPVVVQNVIVNDNEDCSANPLAKLATALKAEGHDPGLLARIPATSSVQATMKYGDVATVPLFGCEPVRVRVVTDRGEKVYDLE